MRYYSDKTKKLYDSEEELFNAEKRVEELEAEEVERKKKLSNEKKDAALKVQLATEAYEKATEQFEKDKKVIEQIMDDARDDAAHIMAEAHEKCEGMLKVSKEMLRKAKQEKLEAIEVFNKSYGPYKTILTGEKARKEFEKINSRFDDLDFFLEKLCRLI